MKKNLGDVNNTINANTNNNGFHKPVHNRNKIIIDAKTPIDKTPFLINLLINYM